MSCARLGSVFMLCTLLSAGASEAAVINGTYVVSPTTNQIGVVNDLSGINALVLASGTPQIVNLFDIFSIAPVATQPIGVTFNLSEAGGGQFGGSVAGAIEGLAGLGDPGRVSFAPASFLAPTIGLLTIRLSSADFASDYNGTVLATFDVPEPVSSGLLALAVIGLGCAVSRRTRGV